MLRRPKLGESIRGVSAALPLSTCHRNLINSREERRNEGSGDEAEGFLGDLVSPDAHPQPSPALFLLLCLNGRLLILGSSTCRR